MKQSNLRDRQPATSSDKQMLTKQMKNFLMRCEFLITLVLAFTLIYVMIFVHQERISMEQIVRTEIVAEKQPAETSWRTTVQNRSEASLKLGQGQSDTTNKLSQGQSERPNKVTENDKLAEEEEFFPVFEEQEERLLGLEINCENLQKKQISQEEHRHQWMQNILVDDDGEFLYCAVANTRSRNLEQSLTETSGRISKEEIESRVKSSSSSVFAQHENFLKLVGFKSLDEVYPPSEVQHKLDNCFKFLVVRDPWTRLLSAFRENFEKKDSMVQDSSPNYFSRLILERYRENGTIGELITGSGVTFSEFLQFIVDEGRYGLVSKDWMSIHDMCHPCLVKYNYIAKMETINPDSIFLLHRTSNQFIEFPDKHLTKADSIKAGDFKDILQRYYSSVPKEVLDGIRKLYALDFELFGYDINVV